MRNLVWALLAASALAAQGPATVEIDNSWVRVLRVKLPPHQTTPLEDHSALVTVFLTEARERTAFPDGIAQEVSRKPGEVVYSEPARHSEINVTDQPLEAVLIELKPGAPKNTGWPVKLDPVKLDPQHHTVPVENSRVRVLRTVLEPHLKSPLHDHPAYVVVYLTELHTTMTLADGKKVDNPRKPGEIAWRDAYSHVTENIGDKTAVEIQVELK